MAVMVRRQRITSATILVLVGALAVFAFLLRHPAVNASQASDTTSITLIPQAPLRVGEPIVVQVVATNARNLAGFQATVGFDGAKVKAIAASVTKGLQASGRDSISLGPVITDAWVKIGAATCPTNDCTTARYSKAPRALQGVQGQVDLAEIVLLASEPGTYTLTLQDVQLVDPQGSLLATTTANATVTVSAQ